MECVSVIIPVFNSEKWVCAAIDSVFAQSYPAIEIVIVDDGSTDNTVAVARERLQNHADSSQIVVLPANQGPSAARNAGLQVARGTWVQFLDSDDLIMPHKIAREMAIAASAPQDVAAVYSSWNWGFLENGQIEWLGTPQSPSIAGKAPVMCFAADCRPLLGACLLRRSALARIGGFDETLRFWECEDACARLAAVGRFLPGSLGDVEYFWRLDRNVPYVGTSSARYKASDVGLGWIRLVLKAVEDSGSLDGFALPEADKRLLLDECTTWARALFANDRLAFRQYLTFARRLDTNLSPSYPAYISKLSRWIGYENAEAVGMIARWPRQRLGLMLRRLKLRQSSYRMVDIE